MGISRENMQNSSSLGQYDDEKSDLTTWQPDKKKNEKVGNHKTVIKNIIYYNNIIILL